MNKRIWERTNLNPTICQAFCQRNQIRELWLFGSVLRDDFGQNSDLDFLVVFEPDAHLNLMELVRIQQELEDLTQRRVDLIERRAILKSHNPIRRQHILNTAKVIYESRPVISI